MTEHPVVCQEEWEAARKKLLKKEKESSKLREELTTLRQGLPWEKVEKEYTFDGPDGEKLAELFDGKSQLIVYHCMFDPDWREGCTFRSIIADHYNPSVIHLNHRDAAMVTVSRAPLDYSSSVRGLENLIGAYNLPDIVPGGRDESALKNGMDWVRRHDQYRGGRA